MQTSKIKPFFKFSPFKQTIRTVGVTSNNAVLNEDKELKSWKEIPGPSSLPIIRQLRHLLPGGELSKVEVPGYMQQLFDKYGPMIRFDGFIGIEPLIMLGDPELAEQVLRGENRLPIRPSFFSLSHYRREYKKSKGIYVGTTTGLISEHGEAWKEFRSAVNPVMLQPKTIKLYCSVLDQVAMDMIKRMKAGRDEKNMIRRKFDIEMNLWALESIGTVALGCRLNCLDENLPEDSPQKELIQCIHDLFVSSDKLDFKPNIWKYIATPQYKKAMKLHERHEAVTKYFLQKGIEELKKTGQKSDHEKGVLEKLLEINEEYAYTMASDMLFAGIDTAANTITSTLYLLATNQDKQDKLREEILSKSERRPYLKACIKEGIRMMPVVSGNIRKVTKDYNLMGYKIPKGMCVSFSHYEMSYMEQQFPRPKEYIPERWIVDKNDPLYYGNAHPFAHVPFGFGARSCIGRRIAELETETFLGRIIEHFKVVWFGSTPKVVKTSLVYFKEPFNFIFTDVNNKSTE